MSTDALNKLEIDDHKTLLRLMIERRDTIKSNLPSDFEIELINLAKSNGVITARLIANAFDLSPQNASNRLVKLAKKQFLSRLKMPDPSGGHYYAYSYALS